MFMTTKDEDEFIFMATFPQETQKNVGEKKVSCSVSITDLPKT